MEHGRGALIRKKILKQTSRGVKKRKRRREGERERERRVVVEHKSNLAPPRERES